MLSMKNEQSPAKILLSHGLVIWQKHSQITRAITSRCPDSLMTAGMNSLNDSVSKNQISCIHALQRVALERFFTLSDTLIVLPKHPAMG